MSKRLPVSLVELRKCMRERGLRAADLARGADLSKAAAGAILVGASNPDPDTRIWIEFWTEGRVLRSGWDTPALEAAIRAEVRPFQPARRFARLASKAA